MNESRTPLADSLKRLDDLPQDQAEISGTATQHGNKVVAASIKVGDEKRDVAAAGGWTSMTGWFTAARARWSFGKK